MVVILIIIVPSFFFEAAGAGNSNSLAKIPVMNTRIKSHEDGPHPSMKIVIGGSDNQCNNYESQ